jgi:hypothetical protein
LSPIFRVRHGIHTLLSLHIRILVGIHLSVSGGFHVQSAVATLSCHTAYTSIRTHCDIVGQVHYISARVRHFENNKYKIANILCCSYWTDNKEYFGLLSKQVHKMY